MRLMQTIASNDGFRVPARNDERLKVLDQVLGAARENSADLVMLPGGYLAAGSVAKVPDAIAEVERCADAGGVAVIGGIDVIAGSLNPKQAGKKAAIPDLPYYGFAVGSVLPAVAGLSWKQTSSTSGNWHSVRVADVPGAGRVVEVAGSRVGVLICGELFSENARVSFAELELDLALDLGHDTMRRVTRTMENLARDCECAVAHTHHVLPHSAGSLHFLRADGQSESTPISECDWRGDERAFWIAWRFREV